MINPKHTPAPWAIRESHDISLDITGPDNQTVAIIAEVDCSYTDSETKANAHLIAACPEMLEAARLVLANSAPYDDASVYAVNQLKQAIAKAEGRES